MLYLENGYVNMRHILDKKLPFNFVIGGRGTGKTYGILDTMLKNKYKFMLLRRTLTQIDLLASEFGNPFRSINNDNSNETWVEMIKIGKNLATAHRYKFEGEEKVIVDENLCYATALSVIKNARGFDASDIKYMIFDEFIPENNERVKKFEGEACMNAYETINRNRELRGDEPLCAIFLANSNQLDAPILMEFELVEDIIGMIKKGQSEMVDRERGVGLWMLKDSPISDAKKSTALYRAASPSFASMAIDNKFGGEYMECVAPQNLREYRPMVQIGQMCIYRHKSLKQYYVSGHISGSPPVYPWSELGIKMFNTDFRFLHAARYSGRVLFESPLYKIFLTQLGF